MTYSITEKLIHGENRPGTPLKASGVAIHSTATPGATDEAEQSYFENNKVGASAHYFVDWDSITQIIPETEVAWHAGPTANRSMLSIEMCEPKGHNVAQFFDVWRRTIWLTTDICRRHNINVGLVWSHDMISAAWRETDHTDPTAYLAAYGKTFDDFRREVELALKPKPQDESEDEMTKQVITGIKARFFGNTGKVRGKDGVVHLTLATDKGVNTTVNVKLAPEDRAAPRETIAPVAVKGLKPRSIQLGTQIKGKFTVDIKVVGDGPAVTAELEQWW